MNSTAHESLNLSCEELEVLAELLESARARLLIEIRHTDHQAFRDELRKRLALVEFPRGPLPCGLSGTWAGARKNEVKYGISLESTRRRNPASRELRLRLRTPFGGGLPPASGWRCRQR